MKTIQLNEQQLNNLNSFLARVELKGAEVGAFNNLVNAIFGTEAEKVELAKEETKEEPKNEAKE